MIKLTNAAEEYLGETLYINPSYIITIFSQPTDGGSLRTNIFGGTHGTLWVVEESPEEVIKKIEIHNKNRS